MRPLELRLKHFGPYRDEAVLDFTALDRLFLVCGPTGAGKTTLFDALTYALYEETPGTRNRLQDQLVSHHAPEGSVPEVSLRFSLGADQWRVTRQLRHRVRKQRGEGWKDQDAQVLLEKAVPAGWEPVPGKRSEINQKLTAMLGLSAEEFAKIVVLPQGDFQRFLEASSGDREKMLQKLFPVEAYDRLTEELKRRAREVEDDRKRWEDRWQELEAQAGGGTGDREALEAGLAGAQERSRAATGAEQAAAAALTTLEGLHRDWKVLEDRRRDQAALEVRRPETEASRARRDRARLARPLGADLDRRSALTAEGRSLKVSQEAAAAARATAEADLAAAAAREPEIQANEARLAQVLRLSGELGGRKARWDEAQRLRADEAQAGKAEDEARSGWEAAEAAWTRLVSGTPPPAGDGLEAALNHRDEARSLTAAVRTRDETVRLAEAARTARTASEEADAEEALWQQVTQVLQAATLAQSLAPGAPCPVCGSPEHPRPAVFPEASAQAPARLTAARASAQAARKAWAEAQTRADDAARRLSGLPDPGTRPLAEAEQAEAAAVEAAEAWSAWTKAETLAVGRKDQARTAAEAARKTLLEAQAAREALRLRRETLAGPEATDPTAELAALAREASTLRDWLDDLRRRRETAQARREAAAATEAGLETQLQARRDELTAVNARLEAGCAPLGWTRDELAAARLGEAALEALEAGVARFDEEVHRLEGQIAGLEARFSGGAPEALEPGRLALAALREARDQAEKEAREADFALRARDKLEADLRETRARRKEADDRFQALVPVARALDGKNDRNLRLTTWVLVQALEQITRSATHRLAAMSGGRYALKVQSEGSDGRRVWGLDLAVIDSYTGQERGVGTLSGGEKFMTSISLALGLADVIQERSGGLKLEAIFIDEGFGTLDDQSLDRAMQILHDLGQHRSVGLISHVAELRQRIASRVEVVKGRGGSTLKVG